MPDVAGLIARTRSHLASQPRSHREWAASYVDALLPGLQAARLGISGRRAVQLAKGVLAIDAAAAALGLDAKLPDAAFLALKYGLPQRAQGREIGEQKLKAIHREALNAAGQPKDSPWHGIRALSDPVARIAAALPHFPHALGRSEISSLVSDAFAGLSKSRRYLLARHLLPIASRTGCLNVPTFELLSEPLQKVRKLVEGGRQSIVLPRSEAGQWDALLAAASEAGKTDPTGDVFGNILLTLKAVEKETFDPKELLALDRKWRALFAGVEEAA